MVSRTYMDRKGENFILMDQDPFQNQRTVERSAMIVEALQTISFASPASGDGNFIDQCKGLRVLNFTNDETASVCDHPDSHSEKWNEITWGRECIEVGTVTKWSFEREGPLIDVLLTVRWDCGKEMQYSYIHTGWENIRVLDLAATGYLASMVYCDVCYEAVMGFAFRCASDSCAPVTGADVLYDLCSKHYNEDKHFTEHPFRCNIPTGDITTNAGLVLQPRSLSNRYKVVGMYPNAIVAPLGPSMESQLTVGRILRIVHADGQEEVAKANYWKCSAEVDPEPYSKEKQLPLQYWDVGTVGKVDLKAIEPSFGGYIYASHFPSLGFPLLQMMARYHQTLHQMSNGKKCWMRKGPSGAWWSISITDTDLTQLEEGEEIWSFCERGLEVLNLMRNNLEMLPARLEIFKNTLKLLCLSFNCFTDVPHVTFTLTSLMVLNMIDNQISRIPNELGKLSQLTTLYFGRNKLRSFPDVFGNLPNLLEVCFEDNLLVKLPPSFSKLQQLKRVELGYNQFTEIPKVLFALQHLNILHIEHNRIQHIPQEIDPLLPQLASLNLTGNPLQHPVFLACAGSKTIPLVVQYLSHFRRARRRRSLRVLVLGKCGSGKTSVVKAFHKHEYVNPAVGREHDHTIGVNCYSIPVNMGGDVQEIVLWDFAGEEISIIINEIFQSDGTLVWLVVNLEDYKPENYHENVGFWLKSILTRILRPNIWVLGTHTDKLQDENEIEAKCFDIKRRIKDDCHAEAEEIEKMVAKLEQELKCPTQDFPSRHLLQSKFDHYRKLQSAGPGFLKNHVKVIPLTNTHSFKGYEVLQQSLENLSSEETFYHLDTPLPDRWVNAAACLTECGRAKLLCSQPPIIQQREAYSELQYIISSSMEVEEFLTYLHQNGEILLHSSHLGEKMTNTLVLDVPWLNDIFKQVFRHDFDKSVQKKYERHHQLQRCFTPDGLKAALEEKRKSGVIQTKLLKALWSLEGVTRDTFPTIISLISEFGLAYHSERPEGYLFPWLLPERMDTPILSPEMMRGSSHVTVQYGFSLHTPKGVYERFTVLCRQQIGPFTFISRNAFEVHSNGAYLCVTYTPDPNGKIELHVQNTSNTSPPMDYKNIWKVVMQLVAQLETLLREWPGHEVDRFVLCPDCIESTEEDAPNVFPLEYIWPGPNYTCQSLPCPACTKRSSRMGSHNIGMERIVPPQEFMLKSPKEMPQDSTNQFRSCFDTLRSEDAIYSRYHQTEARFPTFEPTLDPTRQRDWLTPEHVLHRAMQCHRPISEVECLQICSRIQMGRAEWLTVASGLRMTRTETDDVLCKYAPLLPPSQEICYDFLRYWLRKVGRNATVSALANAVHICKKAPAWIEAFSYLLEPQPSPNSSTYQPLPL